MQEELLTVNHLKTEFYHGKELMPAVDDISFRVKKGEILGIVGESGCGKSVTAMSIMRLIPERAGKITSGEILFNGVDLHKLPYKEFLKHSGCDISMIFQEPLSSLNPLHTCGHQIAESLMLHKGMKKAAAMAEAVRLMELVGIPFPEKRVGEYPHQLSGGMRQRVMIAMSVACKPKLLIADEPTTALDVTIQAQIITILKDLKEKIGMSVLFITHDLGLIANVADRVITMYAGNIVEEAEMHDFFRRQRHPYTQGLLKSLPNPNSKDARMYVIEGMVPSIREKIVGCKFYDRCTRRVDRCKEARPPLVTLESDRRVACWLYADGKTEGMD